MDSNALIDGTAADLNQAEKLAFSVNDPDFKAFLPEDDLEVMESRWTDFNIKDPGVTTLEALRFALIDRGYRYQFPVSDLLQAKGQNGLVDWTLKKLQTKYASSENDYRRTIGFLPELANVVAHPAISPNAPSNTRQLACLLNIFVAPLEERSWENAEALLIKNRELGIYFNREAGHKTMISPKMVPIDVSIRLNWSPGKDTDQNRQTLKEAIDEFLLPKLTPLDLSNLFKDGLTIEEAFTGPITLNPQTKEWVAISPESLSKECYRRYLMTSQLVALLLKLPFVSSVDSVVFKKSGDITDQYTSYLNLERYCFTCLQALEVNDKLLKDPDLPSLSAPTEDNPLPGFQGIERITGTYHNLGSFDSVQLSFPPNYELGNFIHDYKAGQDHPSRNFRTYLALFDQILGDLNKQMGELPRIFAPESCEQVIATKDLSEQKFYKDIAIPKPTKPPGHLRQQLTQQRLNYLLALNGYSFADAIPHYLEGQNLEQIKRDFLRLISKDSNALKLNTGFNALFQSTALGLLQESLRIILSTDVNEVRVFEHCFLQPVANNGIGLNFEITIFIFPKVGFSEKSDPKNRVYNFTETLVKSLCPAHIVASIQWKHDRSADELDTLFNCAFPAKPVFYFDQQFKAPQRDAMKTIMYDWVLANSEAS